MQITQSLPVSLALVGAAMAKNIVVQVSDSTGALKYSPNDIKADVGDTVEFVFNPKNHTVSESSFGMPCVPLSGNGFNSGFNPVAAGADTQPTFTYKVADSNPHWFYCAQGKHCESGMVGVINAPAAKPENNINSFTDLAKKVNMTVIPSSIGGGDAGSIKAGSVTATNGTTTLGSAISISATPVTTQVTYTSNGQAYTAATTELVASYSQQVYTTALVVTSNGAVVTQQTVATAAVPVLATGLPGSDGTAKSGAAAGKVAGAGVAVAAGAAAAAILL